MVEENFLLDVMLMAIQPVTSKTSLRKKEMLVLNTVCSACALKLTFNEISVSRV